LPIRRWVEGAILSVAGSAIWSLIQFLRSARWFPPKVSHGRAFLGFFGLTPRDLSIIGWIFLAAEVVSLAIYATEKMRVATKKGNPEIIETYGGRIRVMVVPENVTAGVAFILPVALITISGFVGSVIFIAGTAYNMIGGHPLLTPVPFFVHGCNHGLEFWRCL
jgi:hypothetical protein